MPPSKPIPIRSKQLPTIMQAFVTSTLSNTPGRILRLLPSLAKYLLYLLVLLNFRSFPLVWHWRVFWPVTRLRLQYRLFRLGISFKSHQIKQKLDAQWRTNAAPVGQNPLEAVVKYSNWAGIDDSDFNIHLSNSSYAKALDFARFDAAVKWFPLFFWSGGWCPLAATHYHFIREIPMFSKYEVRVRIGAWDDKWMYLVCRFVTKPRKGSKAITGAKDKKHTTTTTPSSSSQTPPDDNATNDNVFISANAMHTPATDLDIDTSASPTPLPYNTNATNTPHPPPNANTIINSLLQKQALVEEPDGAVLHTTSVSQVCYKFGRITVPPAVVLALNGFTVTPPPPPPSHPLVDGNSASVDLTSSTTSSVIHVNLPTPTPTPSSTPPPIAKYSHSNPPPHWSRVQSLVFPAHGGSTKKVQELFKGGWKGVPVGERWWEDCLGGEVEERRRERLSGLEGIRRGTEGVRGLL